MSQKSNPSGDDNPLSLPSDNLDSFLAYNSAFLLYLNQNQILFEENRSLQEQVETIAKEKEAVLAENKQLKAHLAAPQQNPKRKYSKRRNWLEKKYQCSHTGCHNAYSSKIALNLHTRKRHSNLKLEEP